MKSRLAAPAVSDITHILDWSRESFGFAARARYERLIARGLRAIAAPTPPTASRPAGDAAPGVQLFHLRHVRRESDGSLPVGRPRHVLAYRIIASDLVIVLRVLHDAMDLPAHLVEDGDPYD